MTQKKEFASPQDALAHFGVKGMHWGVRKDTPGASTENRALRKEGAKAVRNHMWDAVKNEPWARTMSQEEYNALSNRGQTFAVGTKLTRISKSDSAKIEDGALYVSKMKADHEFYKAVIPATNVGGSAFVGAGKKYKTPSYDVELKTVKKLSLPSDKARVDAFTELLGTPSIKLKGKDAPITGRQYLERIGYKYAFRKKSDQEASFLAYHDFLQGQGAQDNPLNKAYFDLLKKKGYNAVVDANDAGRYTTKPLIILDANHNVKTTRIRPLTADEINQAQRSLATKQSPGAIRYNKK